MSSYQIFWIKCFHLLRNWGNVTLISAMFLVIQKGARVPIFSQFLVTPLRLFCTTKSNTNGDAKENKSQKSKTERDLEQVKRFLRKSPELKKKWRKKLEVEESKLYIKSRIENSQKPDKKEEISKRKLFKQQPLDPQILEYIKKYKLHFVYPGEAPPKVEPDNKFVAGVFIFFCIFFYFFLANFSF